MNNKHLTAADRSKMEILLQQQYTLTDIVIALGFHKSTISREFNKRKIPNRYFAYSAQLDYEDKREECGKPHA